MKAEKDRIAELVRRLKKGDKKAFEELYKLTSPKAYFVALEICKNEHDAEDILQESYIKALEKIDEIDPDKNFVSWFYQVVANKSKDYVKSLKPLIYDTDEKEIIEAMPDENTDFSPEDNLNQEELRNEVMAAIDELTAEKRACIMMMYFGEMSVNEIAQSLEVPVSTVKNRLFTARKDLKNKFEKKGITAFYSAAPLGVVIWALGKTSETVAAAFSASTASAAVLSGASAAAVNGITAASSATAATGAAATGAASGAASTAAATGTGIAAKVAALSVAQKVMAGVVTAGVISGSTAGVATVVKQHNVGRHVTTSAYTEEVTTAPYESTVLAFAEITTAGETTTQAETQLESTTKPGKEPTATTSRVRETEPEETAQTDPETEQTRGRTRASTTRRDYSLNKTTAKPSTTVLKTTSTTLKETTTEPETTEEETTEEITTEPTTQATTAAPATLIIDIIDIDNSVVDTLTLTVPAETELSWEYLVSLVSDNGYEATAGVYGDAVGTAAESGATYSFDAEL